LAAIEPRGLFPGISDNGQARSGRCPDHRWLAIAGAASRETPDMPGQDQIMNAVTARTHAIGPMWQIMASRYLVRAA
jgi:hypothetical protein